MNECAQRWVQLARSHSLTVRSFWRTFPWDRNSARDGPFSPTYVPPTTARGRFDLPIARSPVLYLAESPEHAIAEALQPWRNRKLRAPHLRRAGHPLALVKVLLDADHAARMVDLCDPSTLHRRRVRPDSIASRDRRLTQSIAASIWDSGDVGLRWWSSFWGDWHGVVLFTARLERRIHFGDPLEVSPEIPALRDATAALGMTLAL